VTLRLHPIYQELIEKATRSREKNRNLKGLDFVCWANPV